MRPYLRLLGVSASITLGLFSASCSDPAAVEDTEPGAVRGVLKSGTADYIDEGRSERVYALQRKDGSLISLKLSDRPNVPRESEVFVYGKQIGDTIYVDRMRAVPGTEKGEIAQQRQAVIDPPPLTPPLRAALVSVNPTYTTEMVADRATKADFIKPVMEVSSYGRWTMEFDTFGPFAIPNDCGGSFFDNVGKNGVLAMQAAGIDTTKYDQIQFLLPNTMTSCRWTGFGWDGRTPIRTDGLRGKYNPWSYTKSDREGVMVQEIGHNWGLAHVHFCPGTQTPTTTCTGYSEYGSTYSPMSSGNNVYLNGWERIQMNFLAGCNVITVGTTGTYDLGPLTYACNGPQVLRIAADAAPDHQRYYYIEYRVPVGIENNTGVLVHYSADIMAGGWSQCDYMGPDCPEDWVINPMGGSAVEALLPAGTQWTTPQNVTIKIVSLGDTAKFDISFATPGTAGPTCLDNTPWDNVAPVCRPGLPPTRDGGAGAGGTGGGGTDAGTGGAGGGPPVEDAGSTGGTGGSTTTTGTGGSTTGTGGTGGGDDGCGCRVPGTGAGMPGRLSAIAASAALAMVSRWRRRSRTTTRS
jgi:hypothetical protein